jgi:hypothetical protein
VELNAVLYKPAVSCCVYLNSQEKITPAWNSMLFSHCRLIENSIESHAGVIYSWLFKYTQQLTAGL